MSTDAFRRGADWRAGAWRAASWRSAGVVLSLLLNVLLLGVILGHLFTSPRAFRQPGVLVPRAHVRALPGAERQRFVEAMSNHGPAIRLARKAQRQARAVIEDDIGAPSLDMDKLTADFAALREANGAVQAAVNAGLVDALGALSPASRAALVARGDR